MCVVHMCDCFRGRQLHWSSGKVSAVRLVGLGSVSTSTLDVLLGWRRNFTSGGEPCRFFDCHRSQPNFHCSQPNCHNNLQHPLISFGLAVGQIVSGYFVLQDTPGHRPSQLSSVLAVTDMFMRPCPALVCFLGPGVTPSRHTSGLKIGTPVATLAGAWRYRISAGTGWPSAELVMSGAWQGSLWSIKLSVTSMTQPESLTGKQGLNPGLNETWIRACGQHMICLSKTKGVELVLQECDHALARLRGWSYHCRGVITP